jgi:triosephosphate isomerase
MRKKIVAGNWKMNMNYEEGLSLFSEITHMASDELHGDQQVIVCPPYFFLPAFAQLSKTISKVAVGAQNHHHLNSGAYTGEVSAPQIASTGAQYVILGHSERRAYFHEDDTLLAQKVDIALENGLKPIFCVGETQDERTSGRYFDVIAGQIKKGIGHLNPSDFENIILAYEPVWAIGTGLTASPEQAQEVHAYIREQLAHSFTQELADNCTILYGGSCNPKNAPELFAQKDIDGGLIGGASLKSRDFIDIAKVFNGQ